MLHFVHQLSTNFVHLLYGAERVVLSGFIRAFSLQTVASCGWKRGWRKNQIPKVVGGEE